jgi:peroxiredoxin (alkyl hydroperoxide reductase subunit C)
LPSARNSSPRAEPRRRFASVNDLSVGRNPEEVLRVLDALQTSELCPCNWKQGEATLDAA